MDDGLQFEKDYHFILGRILSRLEDLPFDAPWWSATVYLTFRDVAGIGYDSLSKIRDKLVSEGFVESAKMDVKIKDDYVEQALGFDPEKIGICDETVFPMIVKISEYFEGEVPKIVERWESELNQFRKESNKKTSIVFSVDRFSHDNGLSTLSYDVEKDSKRYRIIEMLNNSAVPLTRVQIFDGLPKRVRGTSDKQVSKDIRDINNVFKKRLQVKKNIIINVTGGKGKGYKFNEVDYRLTIPKK